MQNKDFKKTFIEKIKKENEKVANQKLGKVRNLIKIILSFLFSKFLILAVKLGFKNLGKKFSKVSEFSTWPKFSGEIRMEYWAGMG